MEKKVADLIEEGGPVQEVFKLSKRIQWREEQLAAGPHQGRGQGKEGGKSGEAWTSSHLVWEGWSLPNADAKTLIKPHLVVEL